MTINKIIWIGRFEWKIWIKHHVTRAEVEQVFRLRPEFYFVEKGDHPHEDLYLASGRTEAGRYLVVWFIHKAGNEAVPISARQMTPREKRRYAKNKK